MWRSRRNSAGGPLAVLSTTVVLLLVVPPALAAATARAGPADGELTSATARCRDRADEDVTTNETAPEGAGRGVLGTAINSVFPWIVILWRERKREELAEYGDGLLAGLGIRVHSYCMLADMESSVRAGNLDLNWYEDTSFDPLGFLRKIVSAPLPIPDPIQYRPTTEIDVGVGQQRRIRYGFSEESKLVNRTSLGFVSRDLLRNVGANIGFFHLTLTGYLGEDQGELEPIEESQFPKLQTDPEAKDDCFAYSYNFYTKSFFVATKIENKRVFSRWPVRVMSCTKEMGATVCELSYKKRGGPDENKVGGVCRTLSDVGAPVLCGGLLSYVVVSPEPPKAPEDNCREYFRALRLADRRADLSHPSCSKANENAH